MTRVGPNDEVHRSLQQPAPAERCYANWAQPDEHCNQLNKQSIISGKVFESISAHITESVAEQAFDKGQTDPAMDRIKNRSAWNQGCLLSHLLE
jgi:hypothetical protein